MLCVAKVSETSKKTNMRTYFSSLLALALLLSCQSEKKTDLLVEEETSEPKTVFIEILDEKGSEIVDASQEIKIEASGYTWTEGPVWVEDGKYLLFSDIPNNRVCKLTEAGDTSTYLMPSGVTPSATFNKEPGSNGLLINEEGELVLLQHGDRRVAKMDSPLTQPDEKYTSIVRISTVEEICTLLTHHMGYPSKWMTLTRSSTFKAYFVS